MYDEYQQSSASRPADFELDEAIRDARARLDAFDQKATTAELLFRLRQASPYHPFLVMRFFGLNFALLLLAAALGALIGPFVNEDVAQVIARLDDAAQVPLFAVLAGLVVCVFAVGVGGHFAGLAAARSATLLPHEAKHHQRLVADLQQLEAQRAVLARISPGGAEPRVQPRIDRRWE